MDYGTLSCMSFNEIGRQRLPCTFTISPASEHNDNDNNNKNSCAARPRMENGVSHREQLSDTNRSHARNAVAKRVINGFFFYF